MDNQKLIIAAYTELTFIEQTRQELNRKEQEVRQKISAIKKEIEKEQSHLIGKSAKAINEHGIEAIVVCTAIMCNDLFQPVPLFKKNGKNYTAEIFEWL